MERIRVPEKKKNDTYEAIEDAEPLSPSARTQANEVAAKLWRNMGYPDPKGYKKEVSTELPWWSKGLYHGIAAAKGSAFEPWEDPQVSVDPSYFDSLRPEGRLGILLHEQDHLRRGRLDNWLKKGQQYEVKSRLPGVKPIPSGETFMDDFQINEREARNRMRETLPKSKVTQYYQADSYPTESSGMKPENLEKFQDRLMQPSREKLMNTFYKDLKEGRHPVYTPENLNFSPVERFKQRLAGVTPIDPREAVDWHSAMKTNREDLDAYNTWYENLRKAYEEAGRSLLQGDK